MYNVLVRVSASLCLFTTFCLPCLHVSLLLVSVCHVSLVCLFDLLCRVCHISVCLSVICMTVFLYCLSCLLADLSCLSCLPIYPFYFPFVSVCAICFVIQYVSFSACLSVCLSFYYALPGFPSEFCCLSILLSVLSTILCALSVCLTLILLSPR